LIHVAYETTLGGSINKKNIFYHVHNPSPRAQLNFLQLNNSTNWLVMVREPMQSCESWLRLDFQKGDYLSISTKIVQMLFEIDKVSFSKGNSIGVRLEDLKEHPKKTISSLCDWLGIDETESLYHMTMQGKKWWGDPISQNYLVDGMHPFGKSSVNRKVGSIFSEPDRFILDTLFYPFTARFGYVEENPAKFKENLKTIKKKFNGMFDFEKSIAHRNGISKEQFMKSGGYLYLRSKLTERWNTLNKDLTYQHMLEPLKIC